MKKLFFMIAILSSTHLAMAAEVVDRVVAVVGNEMITLSDVKKFPAQKGRDPLEALIHEKLLKQEIDHMNIVVSDEELAGSIRDVLARNHVSLEQLKSELAHKDTSYEQYKKTLASQVRQVKFMAQVIYPRIKVTDEEINRKKSSLPSSLPEEEASFQARLKVYEEKAPEELDKYLEEVRAKTYVEIRKP